jgi:hypothetical protein
MFDPIRPHHALSPKARSDVQIQNVFHLLESEADEHRICNVVGNILLVFARYRKFYHWKADNTWAP